MAKFSALIYIGRFEPPHNGHLATIRTALEQTEKMLVFIGSHEACRSLRNPFTSDERMEMLRISLTEVEQKKVIFIPIHDSNYNHVEWLKELKEKVLDNEPKVIERIGIIGYQKDRTSYYLDLFPEWEFLEMPLFANGLSSTEIRNKWFSGTLTDQDKIPLSVYTYLKYKENEVWAKNLKEEYRLVEEYKKEWAGTPYPPIFVAGDALVICREHILLIRRAAFPGKGLYAMAGGFLDSREPIRHCAIRELIEETGIEVNYRELDKSIREYQVFDDPHREPRGRMISHTFLFDLHAPELPKLKASDDASEAVWYPLSELKKIRELFAGDHYKIIMNMLSNS
ncbi:MAG: bifunctional nicotinamide-nucleotide adenylyltransferase/Nudix hydroxylase [Fibromonadaceae bacterium]|jgi:bifunctional NMN adenylyltransferase/nudix hydrolase|nr:bifunctional nicotinamide-nucleotide adenylyltransferase/Nudix hydroxylase [Fibromonadaceae bacterium]